MEDYWLISGIIYCEDEIFDTIKELHRFRKIINYPLCTEDDIIKFEDNIVEEFKQIGESRISAQILNIVKLPKKNIDYDN